MRRRGGEADDDGSEIAGGYPLDVQRRALGQLQDPPGIRQERHPGRGERDRPGGAVDELHAEFVLQLLDLPAQRRLGHVQTLGGPPEVQLLGYRNEAGQAGK